MPKTYKPRTLNGALKRVGELQQQIAGYEQILKRWEREKLYLARLAATGPAFFNPLDVAEAETIRNKILDNNGMRPDGSFNKSCDREARIAKRLT